MWPFTESEWSEQVYNEDYPPCEGAITGFFYRLGSFTYRDNTSREEREQSGRTPLF